MKDEALKLALDALKASKHGHLDHAWADEAIAAGEQAIAAPVQPAAWESEMRSELAKLGFEGQCPESIGITIKRWFDAYAESLTAQPAFVQEPMETYIHHCRYQPHPNDFGIPKGHWWQAKQYADAVNTTPPAAQRQHVTDGSLCWCEPETSYTDPETGASVVVHKGPQ